MAMPLDEAPETGRVLIVAPAGPDAETAAALLRADGLACVVLQDIEALAAIIDDHAGAALVSEEMFAGTDLNPLVAALDAQPRWSDLPFVLIAADRGRADRCVPAGLANVMVLERPLSDVSLLSAVKWALGGRRHQYVMRDQVRELERRAELLRSSETALREQTRTLAILNRTGAAVAADSDLELLVHRVVEAGVELTGAEFGAFFYDDETVQGESHRRYALAGAAGAAFEGLPIPRMTAVTEPTYAATGILRSDDITADPRYGRNPPYRGLPHGHPPVRSYLAVSVAARSGEVLGGLLFGHAQTGMFASQLEPSLTGLAAEAAIALDNIRLFRRAQREIDRCAQAEKELREFNETLERRVAEDLADRLAAEERRRQMQKLEAVGQLTGGIAQDFNDILTGIIGAIDTMKRRLATGRTEDLERFMDTALSSAQRAASLIHRLLAFSRRQALEARPVDINGLVETMRALMNRSLGAEITLHIDLAADLPLAIIDASRLENALLNLVINARDAMPEGGALTIETSLARLDAAYASRHEDLAEGDYVMLAVSDTGIGMSRDLLTRVFEPFFTTKPIGQGAGLGLSMIYGFARQSGGHIRLHSQPDQGTSVKLYLPLAEAAAEAPVPAAPAQGTGETILVVENDAHIRGLVVATLRDLGYAGMAAADAEAALPILKSARRIDLLVSDIGLSGMNGRQLADIARQQRPELGVLFITGYPQNAAHHAGLLASGIELITKPFATDALILKIRQMMNR